MASVQLEFYNEEFIIREKYINTLGSKRTIANSASAYRIGFPLYRERNTLIFRLLKRDFKLVYFSRVNSSGE